ncbi:hypothetical protein [Sodalis-like endosymbiont of Proechinophthirus fluctus]|uniref:hypothetical protein n=1 Tax=Sodalis-like endosymbiont of Proechinophthirus fluctus TaxID=1462730 RepID=UPI00082AB94F|nr:hypothetical protein [Sodalis-like endosymbiont of Proechinophthirus fluctus]
MLELRKQLKQTLGISIILVTHDLVVVEEMVEWVIVMCCGRVVESADVFSLFARPGYPSLIPKSSSTPHAAHGY